MKPIKPLFTLLLLLGLAAPAAASAQPGCRFFAETGHQVCGRLLQYWDRNGGLPVFGFPTGDQQSQLVDGRSVDAQPFERNRLELHPENAQPYDVLLGRLGADALQAAGRDWSTFGKVDGSMPHFFPQTGHAIGAPFWGYWSSHGLEFDGRAGASFEESLALFGLPLSEPVYEVNPTDGKQYLTQWFERARFELHPENAGTPYEVLLGLLGQERPSAAKAPAPAPAPARQAAPDFAAQVIELVNRERAAAGCPALVPNDALMQIAQAHSQDMAGHDFFEHDGSDGRTPFQRMLDAGYRYRSAAENIAAGASSPADAVRLWMNSPGHRANILNCGLRETGVGYVDDPGDRLRYGNYWTQDFGTR
jgi:uncharacterized protein YkwD